MDDIVRWNEKDLMFWLKDDGAPWHNKGTMLETPPENGLEAAKAAGLDWGVSTRPLYYKWKETEDGPEIEVPTKSIAVVREDGAWISTVSGSFTPLQNLDAFAFFDRALGKEVVYRTAGAVGGTGQVIWILASLPDFFTVGKDDPVAQFLLLSNSHGWGFSGRQAVRIHVTPIRVVCRNTLEAAQYYSDHKEKNKGQVITRFYHSKDVKDQVLEYADTLASIRRTYEETKGSFNAMAKRGVNSEEVHDFYEILFPTEGKERPKRMEGIKGMVQDLFESPMTQAATGTAWGLYNSVTAYVDHKRGKDDNRLFNAWFGAGADLKHQALNLSLDLTRGLPLRPDPEYRDQEGDNG